MSLFRRTPPDPLVVAAHAEARREAAQAELERIRLTAEVDRERARADAEFAREQAAAAEEDRRRRDAARRAEKAEAKQRRAERRAELGAKLRPVLPLLLINGGAAYAQAAYAYEEIAPDDWNGPSSLLFAVAFAVALESVAVYVQWHAHDALLLKSFATAASLRRASWGIAAVVAAINYAHFADGAKPTAAAVAFALLSLLSPWLWGLHTRRVQHVQLLAEDANLIDEGGVEFSPQRRRAFPWRSWAAKRWSIDRYERDPRKAWEGYNAERVARKAARAEAAAARKAEREESRAESDRDDDMALIEATEADTRDDEAAPDPWVHAEPAAPVAGPEPLAYRPRWRPTAPRRPRRMAARRPAINVTVVAAPTGTEQAATDPATTGRGSTRKPPAKTAEKVAGLLARTPGLTQEQVAARLQLGERTVRRYWPKSPTTTGVNGHDHAEATR